MSRESKAELTDRLRREGRFDEFKKRREKLKAEGIPANEAWYQAAAEFPPPNGHASSGATSKHDLIPWSKGRRTVNEAEDDFDWLLRALSVDVPPRAGARRPRLYRLLQLMRQDRQLLGEFYRLILKRIADGKCRKEVPERPFLTVKELFSR